MARKDAHIFTETEVFDFYFNIFKLEEGQRVKAGTPLDSINSHKMAYVISDKVHFSTS